MGSDDSDDENQVYGDNADDGADEDDEDSDGAAMIEEDDEDDEDEEFEGGEDELDESENDEHVSKDVIDDEIQQLEAKINSLKEKKAKQAVAKVSKESDNGKQKDAKKQEPTEQINEKAETESKPVACTASPFVVGFFFSTWLIPSSPATKYVPPSMRQSTADERLNRQVRGLLNRLAQSNLHSVGMQLLTIYNDNSSNRTHSSLR